MIKVSGFKFTSDYDTAYVYDVVLEHHEEDFYPERDIIRIKSYREGEKELDEVTFETKFEVQRMIDALSTLKDMMKEDE